MLDPNKKYIFEEQQTDTLDPNKEYDFGSSQELYREAPPTFTESAISIGLEIIPSILGSIGGPKGAMIGSALGNYASQKYRIGRGLQDDLGPGELVASTALSGVGLGMPAKILSLIHI